MNNQSLMHEAFLQRASEPDTSQAAGDLALGAFLTLRLVDQFRAGIPEPSAEALRYQTRATGDYLANLQSDSPELGHLREIVRVAGSVLDSNEATLLWSPLLAFSYWLEHDLRLTEALDVLDTTLRLGTPPESDKDVAAHLQRGRVLRVASDYENASASYETAGSIAERLGDAHSVRLSRIGRAIVLQKVGNLPESDRILRDVAAEAQVARDRDAEARACQDLSNGLELMGRPEEAVPFAFRSFELFEQEANRMRALADVGLLMKALGHYAAADDAFSVVLASDPDRILETNVMLEQLELAALTNDRVAFERWRHELEDQRATLPADAHVDFEIKLGTGYATFGNARRAMDALESAVRRAEQHKLNKYLFLAEAAIKDLSRMEHDQPRAARPVPGAAPVAEVEDVAEKLQLLRASA